MIVQKIRSCNGNRQGSNAKALRRNRGGSMNRTGRMLCILTAFGLALGARPSMGEKLKLKLKWSQEFAKPVDWYVRTSAGIIVAKSGKSLVGIDEVDGSLLCTLSD